MYITLNYHWEDVVLNEECDYGGYSLSPHTRSSIGDVDYEYDCKYDITDIVEYLSPLRSRKILGLLTEEEKLERKKAKEYLKQAIEFLNDNGCIDYSNLENNEDFVEFLKDRYEYKAWDEFQDSNDAY